MPGVEAAASFDELTRSGHDNQMVRQVKNAWPNEFRSSRFVPAVEYAQANRARTKLINEMAHKLEEGRVLAVAKAYQDATQWHTKHPALLL